MDKRTLPGITVGLMKVFSILQSIPFVLGQSQDTGQNKTASTSDPAISYAQTARELLNQTKMEYSTENSTGAEELATTAYLDNFEYVEPALEEKGAGVLMEQIEGMMREELRNMIKNNVSLEELDSRDRCKTGGSNFDTEWNKQMRIFPKDLFIQIQKCDMSSVEDKLVILV